MYDLKFNQMEGSTAGLPFLNPETLNPVSRARTSMPQQPPPLRKQSFLPLAISAFVYPGTGQCLQGRWAVGLFFAVGFTAAFLALVMCTCWPPLYNYCFVTLPLGELDAAPLPYDARKILGSLALTVLLYLWNVADAYGRSRHPPARPR